MVAELHRLQPRGQTEHTELLGNVPAGQVETHALVAVFKKVPPGQDVQAVADVHSRQLIEHRAHEPALRK